MRVAELIRLLEEQDPEANVTFASQPGWPFEFSIQGIAVRRDVEGPGSKGDGDPYPEGTLCPECYAYVVYERAGKMVCAHSECGWETDLPEDEPDFGEHNLNAYGDDRRKAGGDVILVEGSQLSYASKEIWDNVIYP